MYLAVAGTLRVSGWSGQPQGDEDAQDHHPDQQFDQGGAARAMPVHQQTPAFLVTQQLLGDGVVQPDGAPELIVLVLELVWSTV